MASILPEHHGQRPAAAARVCPIWPHRIAGGNFEYAESSLGQEAHAHRRERRAHNAAVKSTVRTYVTKARNAIASDAAAPETEEAIRTAISNLDRAVRKGVLHRNNADRRKSRLMARLNKAQAE